MSRLLTILLAACLALASVSVRAADDADVARLQARMDTLQADPALGRMAAFEQMEARQAIARVVQPITPHRTRQQEGPEAGRAVGA